MTNIDYTTVTKPKSPSYKRTSNKRNIDVFLDPMSSWASTVTLVTFASSQPKRDDSSDVTVEYQNQGSRGWIGDVANYFGWVKHPLSVTVGWVIIVSDFEGWMVGCEKWALERFVFFVLMVLWFRIEIVVLFVCLIGLKFIFYT